MNKIQTQCGNCIFHKRQDNPELHYQASIGLCIRYPPLASVIQMDGAPRAVSSWPETSIASVCGEWKPDQETQKKAMMQAAFAPGSILPSGGNA